MDLQSVELGLSATRFVRGIFFALSLAKTFTIFRSSLIALVCLWSSL